MIAIYARVSTEEQGKKGYSIRNQIQMCKEKAATNEVIQYVDEGFSGEFLERPELERLRKDVKDGVITKLVCYDPDRLSRKLMNALIIDEEFRKRGVEMVYVNGEFASTPEGQLFYSLRGAISEFEKAKINERMTSGRKRKAIEGKVVKNSFIYGYDYDKEAGTYKKNEYEAKVVKLIFDLFTEPNNKVKGINGIANLLTEQGVPTKKNVGVWHRQVVRQILLNETYTGVHYQNKYNTEGILANKYKKNEDEKVKVTIRNEEEWIKTKIPKIISEDQFNYAQELLSQARRRWANSTAERQYLLSGLVRCENCGNTMTGAYQNNWGTKNRYYSDKKNYSGAKNSGCGNKVKAEELEESVWHAIKNVLDDPKQVEEYIPSNDDSIANFESEQIEKLEEEIGKARKGRKKLMQLFALDDMDTEEIRESIIELREKEELLKEQLDKIQKDVKKKSEKESSLRMLESAREIWLKNEKIDFGDKQQIIRMLVKEITIDKKENVRISFF